MVCSSLILVDDASRENVSRHLDDAYKPAAVLESSPGNYQCILTFSKARTPFDREIANRLTRALNQKYGESNAFLVCFLQKQTIRRLRFAGKARFSRLLTARVSARAATGAVSLQAKLLRSQALFIRTVRHCSRTASRSIGAKTVAFRK